MSAQRGSDGVGGEPRSLAILRKVPVCSDRARVSRSDSKRELPKRWSDSLSSNFTVLRSFSNLSITFFDQAEFTLDQIINLRHVLRR